MKLVVFDEKEIESIKKSDIIKYVMLVLATPSGLLLSCVLAYLNIDFIELLKVFSENISNLEVLDKLGQIMGKWYIISLSMIFVALLLLVIYFVCNKKKNEEALTWGQTLILMSELILISQFLLPLFTITVLIVIALLYFVFFSSVLLKNLIGYGTYLFVVIVEKICTSSGITLTYGEFIGQERYSMFLTMITFLVSIPYILPILLMVIKKIIQGVTGNKIVTLIFKPMEALFSVNVLRYSIYMLLFFTSVFTYSVNIVESDYFLSLVKEALLEFVLLDTVIYSIISNLKDIKINHKQQNMRKYYIPFKYDLEFVLSAISMYNLKYNEMYARIKFSVDINRSLKWEKQKNISEIDKLLIDISTNYYKIEILEQKVKIVLSMVIDKIG
ncbi:hypothetical protein [Parablautia muri]|uniref:Uncharacterized protein n=1 Tax=Parablautia muri TaxID=2320879 RepID=A0A9X5BMN7_9FIRM|nr:hypothetical protein [Parablautia muri]NBJ95572.1 hypothetical protein [Parablautia muri]